MSQTPRTIKFGPDQKDTQFKIVAPGEYPATLVSTKEAISKINKNEMIVWTFDVDGQEMRVHTTFGAKALWKLHQLLLAFGEDPEDNEEFVLVPESYVGQTVWVAVQFQKETSESRSVEGPRFTEIGKVYAEPQIPAAPVSGRPPVQVEDEGEPW